MDIEAFALALIEKWRDHHGSDLDGGDLQDLALKHGLLVGRGATAEEAAELDYCVDWDMRPGDWLVVDSPEFAALRRRAREAA